MAMIGDGIKSYDNAKDGSDTELAGCEVCYTVLFSEGICLISGVINIRLISEERDSLPAPDSLIIKTITFYWN